jgi:hypothetical protein
VTHAFDANGVYPYFCLFHPSMVGAIVVGDGSGAGAARGEGGAPAGAVLTKGGRDGAIEGATSADAATTTRTGRGAIALAAAGGAVAAAVAGGALMLARSGRRGSRLRADGIAQHADLAERVHALSDGDGSVAR